VLPYPGGRHPRIGFLEGAVRPQRDTKLSVFTPWDESSYVVLDLPEAICANRELLYLAHTHVSTIWTKQNIQLEPLEWNRRADGTLDMERRLPNRVSFGAKVKPSTNAVLMELWLANGSTNLLSDLRVQNCVMLKGAKRFAQQTNDNKLISNPYVACKSSEGNQWIISAGSRVIIPGPTPRSLASIRIPNFRIARLEKQNGCAVGFHFTKAPRSKASSGALIKPAGAGMPNSCGRRG